MRISVVSLLFILVGCTSDPDLTPEVLSLRLSPEAYSKVVLKREEALKKKHLYSSKSDYVAGKLFLNSKAINVKARLKGDHTDHLRGDRWSFRIKSEEPVLGHRKFSVQNVSTRRYQLEWAFHRLLKHVGVIGLDYHFVHFDLNDSLNGIYAYESHFKNELLDSNHRVYGPILGFDESSHWKASKFDQLHFLQRDDSLMIRAKLKVYNKKWCAQNQNVLNEGLNKLAIFQSGKGQIDSLIDIKLWSKYITISELMGFFHNLRWHNLKFYYNPETRLLEPIGYDSGANFDLSYVWFLSDKLELLYHPLRNNPEFMNVLKSDFDLIKQPVFLDGFFDKYREAIDYNERLVQLENADYYFQERAFYNSQSKLVIP